MPNIALADIAGSDFEASHRCCETRMGVASADAVITEMIEALECLETLTGLGGPVPDVRELVFARYPFIAPYRLRYDEVQVLRILHQRTERAEEW